jgi:hypothetical protein
MSPTEEEVFEFLVNLRDSGITNMWGSGRFVAEHFDLTEKEGGEWAVKWIRSFNG